MTEPAPLRRILVVTPFYASHGDGVSRVAEKMIQELSADESLRFTWAASACSTLPRLMGQRVLPMRSGNWLEKVTGYAWPVWNPRSLIRLRRAVAEADIVWLHETFFFGNLLAFRWARRLGKPTLVTQHTGLRPSRHPLSRQIRQMIDGCFVRPALRAATQAVFISDRIGEDYYRRTAFVRAVKIIPNGVEPRLYSPPMTEKRRYLRQQFAIRADQPVLLFVGRFSVNKGLPVIQKLAALLPGWRFWLAGKSPRHWRGINPAKWLLPNVHVFPYREGADLAELYQAADMLILPSYGEGFPLPVQEALACGLPVMCSPVTASGSRDAQPLLHLVDVWPRDAQRTATVWAEHLQNLAASLPLEQPQQALADFAHQTWSWQGIAEAYGEIFKELTPPPQTETP